MTDQDAIDPGEFYSQRMGRYFSHCCVNDFNFHHADFLEAFERLVSVDEETGSIRSRVAKEVDLDYAPYFLTWHHERQHYFTLISTGTGLLLWRLNSDILSTAAYMIRRINASSAGHTMRAPLLDWYMAEGREAVVKDPPYDAVVARSLNITEEQFRRAMPRMMDSKAVELQILENFRIAFSGLGLLSMTDFVELGNLAFSIMAERSGFEPHQKVQWTSRESDRKVQLPEPAFSIPELLEADARLSEFRLFKQLGASASDIELWKRRHIFGVYRPAFEWLMQELGDEELARVALEVALNGPVDLSAGGAVNDVVVVEDAHPSWRLIKVVEALKKTIWPWDLADRQEQVAVGIAKRAGIPAPRAVVANMLESRIHSNDALKFDARMAGASEEELAEVTYTEYSEAAMRFALTRKALDPLATVSATRPMGLKPVLEFYQDCAVVNTTAVRDGKVEPLSDSAEMPANALRDLVCAIALYAVLGDGDASDIPVLESSLRKEVRFPGSDRGSLGSDNSFENLDIDLRRIAEGVIGKRLADRLKWD